MATKIKRLPSKIAAAYIRMSDHSQDASPEQQRQELVKYAAANGYTIIEWFEDLGISGDDTEKRLGFLRMREAMSEGRFGAVLCWSQDRFGRFDSVDAGYWLRPFREAGVSIVTLDRGALDLEDFAGRVVFGVMQEAKHGFLVDLSRNVSRGLIAAAKKGRHLGTIPYGYVKVVRWSDGTEKRISRETKFKVPSDCDQQFVFGDAIEVEALRHAFKRYATGNISLRDLCDEMDSKGYPAPAGSFWRFNSLARMLGSRFYVGETVMGKRGQGKYHRIKAGEITKARRNDTADHREQGDWIIQEGAHEPIIDRKTFDAVQRLLQRNKARTSPAKGKAYLFSGLAICGHTNRTFYGRPQWTVTKAGKKCESIYIDADYHEHVGERPFYWFRESELRDAVLGELRKRLLSGGERERLRKALVERLQSRRKPTNARADQESEKRLLKLTASIERTIQRMARIEDERVFEQLQTEVAKMRAEQQALEGQRAGLQSVRELSDEQITATVDKALAHVWTLSESLEAIDPKRLKATLASLISGIVLWFEPRQRGQKTVYRLKGGEITLNTYNLSCSS